MSTPSRIVLRMPNWIGDAVMATPLLKDLKTAFPSSELVALCQGSVSEVLQGNPYITEILRFQKINRWIHQDHYKKIIEPLRKGAFDCGILLTNSLSSAFWFYRGRVERRIGFSTPLRHFLLTDQLEKPKKEEPIHQVDEYKLLVKPLGISPSTTAPELFLTDEEIELAKQTLNKHPFAQEGALIGINPAAAFGSAKCWPKESFQELIQTLSTTTPHRFVVFGDAASASLCKEITKPFGPRVLNLAGKTTLRELIALIDQCDVFLTNDSGPMHIAAARRKPLVALFGSTNPTRTGPRPSGTVLYKQVFCSPCYRRVCPIDFRCMKTISVQDVLEATSDALATYTQ